MFQGKPKRNKSVYRILAILMMGILFITPSLWADEKEDLLFAARTFDDELYELSKEQTVSFLKKYPESNQRVRAKLLLGKSHFELGE